MAADPRELSNRDEPFADTVEALSRCEDDALSEAACGGLLDPNEAIQWAVRAKRLVLFERDRSVLRSEVPALADRLAAPGRLSPDL